MSDRIAHLREIMKANSIDAFLISSSSNIFYLSGFNRFLVEHDGFLFVTQNNAFIITSPLYTQAVKKFTPEIAVLETTPDIWYAQMVKKVLMEEHLQTIGFEENDLRVTEYFDLGEQDIKMKSVSLRTLREKKDEKEIDAIRKACKITDKTFQNILPFITEGITEIELSQKMEQLTKEQNGEVGFPAIVAFGSHSAVPHHMTSDEKLQKNNFILFDFGVKADNYLSDMSRTVFFGTPTNDQIRLYETVKKSQQAALDFISENYRQNSSDIFVKDVDKIARKVIENENFPVYPHALGHGVGLQVHEAPTLSLYSPEKLIEGAVFTLEPGIYVLEMGGVRIEDVYTIHDNKVEQLTQSSKDLIVI